LSCRHAGPDAGHAGADAGAFSRTYLFSDDASAVARAVDAGALAPTDERADLRPYHTGALRIPITGAYASANTNTDAGALREAYAPADAGALRVADALTHGLAPAHARAKRTPYAASLAETDAAPYTYADHAAAVARADAEADTSTNTSTDAAADHMAALARALAETYAPPELPAHALADAAAFPVADRPARPPHH